MQLSIGPYIILGRLHTTPGQDHAGVLQRDPMIPLTSATIAYEVAGAIIARDVDTVIVNRLLVDWISATADEATMFPDAPVRSPFTHQPDQGLHGLARPVRLEPAASAAGLPSAPLARAGPHSPASVAASARSAPRRDRPPRRPSGHQVLPDRPVRA